jgi:hypothetical protein
MISARSGSFLHDAIDRCARLLLALQLLVFQTNPAL